MAGFWLVVLETVNFRTGVSPAEAALMKNRGKRRQKSFLIKFSPDRKSMIYVFSTMYNRINNFSRPKGDFLLKIPLPAG
jgi:hypothetical protein